jgi:hypothetical protein
MRMYEDKNVKMIRSDGYNYNFDKATGYFERWGDTKEDDPKYSVAGPEICDMEITTICNGIGNKGPCPFCYKSNTKNGTYMSFETFKKIFHFLPKTVNQIAFGLDAKCESNPDTFKIMNYCRDNDVIPNVTVADINNKTAEKLADLCGAVSVSYYGDKDICFNSVKNLTDNGLDQVNIHAMIADETFSSTLYLLDNCLFDDRLKKLNAIVMLSLKRKGRGETYHTLHQDKFDVLCDYAMRNNIPIGFDSCSSHKFIYAIRKHPNKKQIEKYVEPCESGLFSIYCDVNGKFYPCSFCEDKMDGLELKDNFYRDVWNHPQMDYFKTELLDNDRKCPIYHI